MSNLRKIGLYIRTISHLKPSQVLYRAWRKLGGKTRLRIGFTARPDVGKADISRVLVLPELDFDPKFLERFDVDAIMDDRIELLHHEERIDWECSWHEPLSTPLWRYNLQYCEYLLPLAKAYLDAGDRRYIDKGKAIVASWIEACPESKGGWAWDPYVISMRIVNWLAFYGESEEALREDEAFIKRMDASLAEQYTHLSQHLEKDLLANHYLENLKALVLLACYFDDEKTLEIALLMLQEQIDEQILPDGMHFELSPMYHKIVLEDLLRVAIALGACGHDADDVAKRFRLQDMCDCLYSMERDTNRTPLFNDSGDNVAKSRDALLGCARSHFKIESRYRSILPDAGYCFLEGKVGNHHVKVIFDVGAPGPLYALGHAHCDALSLEVFVDGEPLIVNRGTYAYQDERRLEFKSAASHSAPQIEGVEQSECWASFRVARHARCSGMRLDDRRVQGIMVDQCGNRIVRTVTLDERGLLVIEDETDASKTLITRLHFSVPFGGNGMVRKAYSPEFGSESESWLCEKTGSKALVTHINLATTEVS